MSAPTYWSQPNQQVVRNGDPVAAGTNDPDPEVVAAADEGGDTFDPSAHTVAEVNDYLDAHPDDADRVLEAEAAGKNRVSIVGDE
jgi:hypothetical protein